MRPSTTPPSSCTISHTTKAVSIAHQPPPLRHWPFTSSLLSPSLSLVSSSTASTSPLPQPASSPPSSFPSSWSSPCGLTLFTSTQTSHSLTTCPSVAFFAAGLLAIYTRRFFQPAIIIFFGTMNRETTLFLGCIYVLDAATRQTLKEQPTFIDRFSLKQIPPAESRLPLRHLVGRKAHH